MCRAAPAVGQCENKLNAATNDIGPATAMAEHTFRSPASVPAVKMLVFAPALATEPKEMLLAWARGVSGLGTGVEAVIVLNGPGSERAALVQSEPPTNYEKILRPAFRSTPCQGWRPSEGPNSS